MSPHDRPTTSDHTSDEATTIVRRRRFLALGLGTGAAMLAGCSGDGATGDPTDVDDGSTDGESGDTEGTASEQSGTFRLLISDRPNAIDDFDSLEVSFDRARVFRSGDGEDGTTTPVPTDATATPAATETADTATPTDGAATTPTATPTAEPSATPGATGTPEEDDEESDAEDDGSTDEPDGEAGGFSTMDLDGATVDLTEVVGAKATGIFEGGLSAGRYTKIELHAAEVRGVVDGEEADVKLPSGKLMLTKPFEVEAGSSVSFVFDISVVKKGNGGYNLLPVVSESGVAGRDVDVEEVGGDGEGRPDDEESESTANGDGGGGGEEGADGEGNEGDEGDDSTPTPEATSTTAE